MPIVEAGGHKAALFVLDLDGFKAVNDTLGHPVGDGLLKACAKRLKASLRSGDLLARLSGDEFAIVVPKLTDPAMLAPLAERVLNLLSSPFRVDGHELQIGCSIGLAVAPDNGADIGTLMRNADFALYRAKSEGRRTWRFFDPKMAEDLASRRTLEDGLRHALENDHFQLLYQPQIELSTGRTIGYEAMLRWRLPGKGLVPAAVFVSIAEETGLVVPIGEWVIRQAARDCALIPPDRQVAINLSATQLKRDGIDTFIIETLKSHRIPPGRIEIEVNETILGRNEGAAFARLEKIRDAGVRVVMDSFGVGTLSLGLLSRYFVRQDQGRPLVPDERRAQGRRGARGRLRPRPLARLPRRRAGGGDDRACAAAARRRLLGGAGLLLRAADAARAAAQARAGEPRAASVRRYRVKEETSPPELSGVAGTPHAPDDEQRRKSVAVNSSPDEGALPTS